MNTQNNEKKQTEEELIDIVGMLEDYLRTLRHMWVWVLILALLGGVVSYARSYVAWTPRYTASATFTITVGQDGSSSTSGSYSFYDNSTTEQMVNTFPYILTSGVLSRRAAEYMGRDSLSGQIRATSEANTNLFTMSVTDSDASLAYETLQAVIECYPEISEVIIGRTSMQLLDETGIPEQPDNPRNGKNDFIKGAAAGGLLGLLWTGVVMLSRSTIQKKADFQKKINMKCIGEVPQIALKKRSKNNRTVLNILNEKTDPRFGEALQLIRSKVEYSTWRHHAKIVLITSALAGEGKSTIAVNLALSLCRNGKKVALIDCDLRNPSDRQILGVDDGDGLHEVLLRKRKLADVLITGKQMELALPNREVRELFIELVKNWFEETTRADSARINRFCAAFPAGDTDTIQKMLSDYLWDSISVRDTAVRTNMKENFYHGMLLGLLRSQGSWLVRSNAETGEGYSDISIQTPERTGIVIELKYANDGKLETACMEALKQIGRKKYAEGLKRCGTKKIMKYGIAFCEKECMVVMA